MFEMFSVPWREDYPLLRLLSAALAGLVLALPYRDRPGGIRIHVLVTLGAAQFCLTGVRYLGSHEGDALRVLQGVTSGIGFIGAASVLKKDVHIYGITTAASIWIAAAIGCEVGLGQPLLAVGVAVVITLISVGVSTVERKFLRPRRHFIRREDER